MSGATRPELCVGAVVVRDGQLLLVQRGRGVGAGHWSVPGGRVEHGETLAAAACRELLEEAGLHGTFDRHLGWAERIGPGYHFVIHDLVVDVPAGEVAVAGDDAAAVRWVALGELEQRADITPGLVEFLVEHGVIG